ncbi:NUDIX hydrolase [Marinobacter daepoensis]|uniref:NUDIX hydrolase n=1 Tax=Marinobacter daepoensis TaxID=262077 RepID=UPI000402D2E1|nr:NUDIX hydrolase [Marinobacter daepoensis]MBY6034095.1 NUDIX hydrolase [Marinobacter daepoensis]
MASVTVSEFQEERFRYPVVATIAVLFRNEEVLLVRRANPPDVGRWGFPGGKMELGETVKAAAVRELYEETGVRAAAGKVFNVVDAYDHDDEGRLRSHFVLIAVLCFWESGEPVAADDALDAAFVPMAALGASDLALSLDVEEIAREAYELASEAEAGGRGQ